MKKINKHLQKIKVTEEDFKDFSKIATIPKHLNKNMVLYLTTWQEMPNDQKETETMTTKPEWFKEYEQKQEKFNRKILSLVESLVDRVYNIEKRLDNLIIKNNLRE